MAFTAGTHSEAGRSTARRTFERRPARGSSARCCPDPTEEFYHPFGLQDYAVTYTGYTLLGNHLAWDNPAQVDGAAPDDQTATPAPEAAPAPSPSPSPLPATGAAWRSPASSQPRSPRSAAGADRPVPTTSHAPHGGGASAVLILLTVVAAFVYGATL